MLPGQNLSTAIASPPTPAIRLRLPSHNLSHPIAFTMFAARQAFSQAQRRAFSVSARQVCAFPRNFCFAFCLLADPRL